MEFNSRGTAAIALDKHNNGLREEHQGRRGQKAGTSNKPLILRF